MPNSPSLKFSVEIVFSRSFTLFCRSFTSTVYTDSSLAHAHRGDLPIICLNTLHILNHPLHYILIFCILIFYTYVRTNPSKLFSSSSNRHLPIGFCIRPAHNPTRFNVIVVIMAEYIHVKLTRTLTGTTFFLFLKELLVISIDSIDSSHCSID